jgi:hypothetical protein
MIRLPLFVAVWALFLAVKVPTLVAGLFAVPLLFRWRHVDYVQLPWWSRPWANPEDWQGGVHGVAGASLPQWWIDREGAGFWSFYRYHALRNPANGLRSFELLDLDVEQERVRYWTPRYLAFYEPWYVRPLKHGPRTYGYIAWQGVRAGAKLVHHWNDERHLLLKIGWRVEPRDAHEQPRQPELAEDASFATKLVLWRKG